MKDDQGNSKFKMTKKNPNGRQPKKIKIKDKKEIQNVTTTKINNNLNQYNLKTK